MPTQTPTHRHFLVAPAFALLLALPVLVQVPLRQSAATVLESSSEIVALPYGAVLLPSDHAQIDATTSPVRVSEGSALVRAPGVVELQVGTTTIRSMAGAFYLTARARSITVVALTAPVLVHSGAETMLVPAGWQWQDTGNLKSIEDGFSGWAESRTMQALPMHFIAEQLAFVQELPEETGLPSPIEALPPAPSSDDLLLPAASERVMDAWTNSVLGRLRALQKQPAEAHALLAQEDVRMALATPYARSLLPSLLSEGADSAFALDLLPFMLTEEDSALLLSVHPAFAAYAWSLVEPRTLSFGAQSLLAWVLPLADTQATMFSKLVYERWSTHVTQWVLHVEDTSTAFAGLVSRVHAQVKTLLGQNYPDRAYTLADATVAALESVPVEKTASTEELLQNLLNVRRVTIVEEEQATVSSQSSSEAPVAHVDSSVLVPSVDVYLQQIGALYTVETALEITSATEVSVGKVVFSQADGDHVYSFTVDVPKKEVHSIRKDDGDTMPFPMSTEQFAEWVK